MDIEVLQVGEFLQIINTVLSDLGSVAIEGEITSLRHSRNGALFADLKDSKSNSLLRISQYAPLVVGLNSITEGMRVRVYGHAEIYAPSGSFNFKPRRIEPVGEGALKLAFEKLQALLDGEGLFALERKRPLPSPIESIALITAGGSAAFADFCKILSEHNSGIKVQFISVAVQGSKAELEICEALVSAQNLDVDAIVLVRGGGSLEDLQAFNSEAVARAIFNSRLPVMVGVGHEVDTTIADLVADVRASTPSQAAYYLANHNEQIIQELELLLDASAQKIMQALPSASDMQTALLRMAEGMRRKLPDISGVDSLMRRVELPLYRLVSGQRLIISQQATSIQTKLDWRQRALQQKIDAMSEKLSALSPQKVLARGYSIVSVNGKTLKKADEVSSGTDIDIRLHKGKLRARVS